MKTDNYKPKKKSLCNSFIDFIIKKGEQTKIFHTSLQSNFNKVFLKKKHIKSDIINSICFLTNNKIFRKHKAIFKIKLNSTLSYNFLYFTTNFIENKTYDLIVYKNYK